MCKDNKYINIQNGEELDLERVKTLPDNAMLKVRPDLWCEWDFEKNHKLGFDIWETTRGSGKKVYWCCKQCNEVNIQFVKNKVNYIGCPTCRGYYASSNYNLQVIHPLISSEWHPTKNGELTPEKVVPKSEKKVWWLGKCGHEWDTMVCERTKGSGCPYCVGKRILKGFNDVNTTHPQISKLLMNYDDGFKYSSGSDKIVKFKCACGNVLTKSINTVVYRGLRCPNCKDGLSFGEKFIYTILFENGIDFEHDVTTSFSGSRRYDFIIPSKNAIIEVHGEQHSREVGGFTFRTLEEERENDRYKKEIALKNNFINYFELHIHNMSFEMAKDEITNTNLLELLDLRDIEWIDIAIKSQKSLLLSVCDFYNNNDVTSGDLARIFKLAPVTVRRYLNEGKKLGICTYDKVSKKNKLLSNRHHSKQVVQLNNGVCINTFISAREAARQLFNDAEKGNSISNCCRGKNKTSNGYKWMYKEDYDNLMK